MRESFPCPRCNRNLKRSGETSLEGRTTHIAVFQCDECLDEWKVEGQVFSTAFTFAVDPAGRVLNADSLEPLT